jgi:hypothetical protein
MENHGLFEKFLNGSMTGSELSDFLLRLSSDPDFEQEFSVYKEIDADITLYKKREDFKKTLTEVADDYFHPAETKPKGSGTKKVSLISNTWIKVAASVAVLTILSIAVYFIFLSGPEYRELYAENYYPFKADVIKRSASDSASPFIKALTLYQNGKYSECSAFLKTVDFPDSINTLVTILKGLAFMGSGDFTQAEIFLKKASGDSRNIMYEDCIWYLSLTYLQLEQPEKCKEQLNELIAVRSSYSEKAKEIIEELE